MHKVIIIGAGGRDFHNFKRAVLRGSNPKLALL
jgi:predicted GTPase